MRTAAYKVDVASDRAGARMCQDTFFVHVCRQQDKAKVNCDWKK